VRLHQRKLQEAIRKNQPLNCDCMLGIYGVSVREMAVQFFRNADTQMAWRQRSPC
jgi:hypothetical protein